MNGYELTRDWFDFRFENPSKCKPIHTELYIYLIDQWNRLGQVKEFGLPTQYTMQILNICSYNTYKKALDDLIEFGFITCIKEAKNQHQSRIIALSKNDKANNKTLDKANAKALYKALYKSDDTIIEQKNNRTIEPDNNEILEQFDLFWDLYGKKTDKDKCLKKFKSISENDRTLIFKKVEEYVKSTPEIKYRKNPLTWLNGKCWNDDIIITQPANQEPTIEKWKTPDDIFMCKDWIKRIPKPPSYDDQRDVEMFMYQWRIKELMTYQYDRCGAYSLLSEYED